jgi:hypothetical protein
MPARHCINNPTTVIILTSVEFSVLMLILPNAGPECDHVWVQQAVIPTHHTFWMWSCVGTTSSHTDIPHVLNVIMCGYSKQSNRHTTRSECDHVWVQHAVIPTHHTFWMWPCVGTTSSHTDTPHVLNVIMCGYNKQSYQHTTCSECDHVWVQQAVILTHHTFWIKQS